MDNKNTDPIKENKNVRFGSSGSVSAGGTTSGEKKPSDVKNVHAVPKGEDPSVERTVNLSNQRPKRQYFARPETDELKLGVERSRIPEKRTPADGNAPSGPVAVRGHSSQMSPKGPVGSGSAETPRPSADGRPVAGQRGPHFRTASDITDDAAQTKQVPIVNPSDKQGKDEEVSVNPEDTIELTNDATQNIDASAKVVAVSSKSTGKQRKIKKKRGDKERSESGNTVLSLVKCMAYITSVFAVSIVISVAVIFIANDMYGFVKSDEQIEVVIPKGTTIDDVAEILYNHKLIKYKWLFNLKEGDSAVTIQPGTYTLTPKSSYGDFVEAISKKPPAGVSWITIPEGYTTDEIIDLLVSSGIGEKEKYVDVINNYDFDYWFIDEIDEDWAAFGRTYRLDGYLFPDTYQFYNASTEVAVINKLLSRFNQVFIKAYRQRTEEIGFVTDETLTLSSIIEKEAGAANYLENCFGNVSSVFHNRLNSENFSHLQSDATTAYVIHHETGVRVKLRGSDLDNIVSEYNTETRVDLTPGAIANSGNSAILAAMHPSDTDYFFFFSPSNPKPGEDRVIFSRTIEEHNAVVSRYS